MNSKRFLIIRIIIVLLSFFSLCFIEIYQRKIIKDEEKRVIEEKKNVNENTIIDASKLYITNNQNYYSEIIKYKDFEVRIDTDLLVKNKLIDNNDKFKGYVKVINDEFSFVSVNETLIDHINSIDYISNSNNEKEPYDLNYIYQGEDPKNYIKYNNKNYRIIGITNSNDLKLISTDSNIENNWGLSSDINYLKKEYDIEDDSYKGVFYVGFVRSETNDIASIIKNEKRNNTYTVSTPKYVGSYSYPSISDIVMASSNCTFNKLTDINKDNCNSYLINMLGDTYTNTTLENNLIYKVNSDKQIVTSKVEKNINIKKVIYVSGYEKYISGNGTKNNPYEIK